ncbi:conserved hypothetical protein [Burkholderiales bacterium 8X]|nr:conserved hypothetical protein [Burkholderiales bacterium 8X]
MTDKPDPTPADRQTAAQKAMKQFAKTDAEIEQADAPVGPNDGPSSTTGNEAGAPGTGSNRGTGKPGR